MPRCVLVKRTVGEIEVIFRVTNKIGEDFDETVSIAQLPEGNLLGHRGCGNFESLFQAGAYPIAVLLPAVVAPSGSYSLRHSNFWDIQRLRLALQSVCVPQRLIIVA